MEGSHDRVPDRAPLRPAEPRRREAARPRVLRERAARRGLPAAAALQRQEPGRPRGAPEARHDLPDGPRARQGAGAGRGDPGAEAARPRRAAAAGRIGRHPRGDPGRDRPPRAEPRHARRPRPRGARARRALRAKPGPAQGGGGVQQGCQLEARLARGAPGARPAAPRQAGAGRGREGVQGGGGPGAGRLVRTAAAWPTSTC